MGDHEAVATVVRSFRLLLRDYFDLARKRSAEDVVGKAVDDILQFFQSHEAYQPVLREILLCSFLDPDGEQELPLMRLCEVSTCDDVAEELSAFYLRRPADRRGRKFRDLAEQLHLDINWWE